MSKKITTKDFLRNLKTKREDNGKFYDYSNVIYRKIEERIIIICPQHGQFEQRAGDHKNGSGCPKCGKEKAKNTCLQKYGVENPFQSEIIKKRIKKTNLQKYGVENPSQSIAIKQKKKETSLKNYGVTNYTKTQEYKERYKKTYLQKYGVEHPLQNREIKRKMMRTKIKNGSFNRSNASIEARVFIREYIKNKNYNLSQVAYSDPEIGLYEWGYYANKKWNLFDLVVFEDGFRGNKDYIIEILEYNGPFHYTIKDTKERGNGQAYPWKNHKETIEESYRRDQEKLKLAKNFTKNVIEFWAPKYHKDNNL